MMTAQALHDDQYVVICGLSPAAYEQVLEAVGDCHPRHTYDRGALELRRVLRGIAPGGQRSLAFPFIAASDIARFLELRHKTDENSVIRAVVDWAKDASSR